MKPYGFSILLIILVPLFSVFAFSDSQRVYLNESAQVTIFGGAEHHNETLYVNLTVNESINLTFEANPNSNGNFELEV